MKRLMILLLLAAVLCGCGGPGEETLPATQEPTWETVVQTVPTEPEGLYVPGSSMEDTTRGGIRLYIPEDETCYAIEVLDGDVLLFSGEEQTTLTRLTGENLYPIAQTQLACMVSPEDPCFQSGQKGITYYDGTVNELVFLDHDLKEVSRVKLPENITGTPVLSGNRLKLYYCTTDAVRVLDLETGLDRLLKQIAYTNQSMEGILFNDTVLQCTVTDEEEYTLFLSVETGELLDIPRVRIRLWGTGERFQSVIPGGIMQEMVFGTGRDSVQQLIPADPFGTIWCQEQANTVIVTSGDDTALTLERYDLETGLRTSILEVSGSLSACSVEEASEAGLVYLLVYDGELNKTVLCRWDLEKTSVRDETVYTGSWYTSENPDEAGLEACRKQAEALGSEYGVEILVGRDAVAVKPWDYDMEPEYQVPVIRRELEKLELLLGQYPKDMLRTMDEDIKICLVRGVYGSAESGSLDTANGIQFWDEGKAYVVLTVGDMLEMTVHHELFHVIDNYILSVCHAYYDWEWLNPDGFVYDLDYTANQSRDPEQYLQEDTRAFIDTYSMSYPKEDRARIMEYAATAGHESCFRSDTMQQKLKVLCQGIRTAFKLKDYPEQLIWEQYLAESLVP